jgi:eight-cysteine-cluster-containing protein
VKIKATLLALLFAAACGPKSSPQPPDPEPDPEPEAACITGGCSGTICEEEGGEGTVTTCEWRDEYACYRDATCERQDDGSCGWTQTDELAACLASPPAAE